MTPDNYQAGFARALLDPAAPVPPGLGDAHGGPAGKRFDIYRNNVAVSLTQALETGFPVIRKLVGSAFFKAMAGVFLRACPPRDPRMHTWGGRFPGFLAGFPPVAHLPYLPDMARLELGLRQSYHAADATTLSIAGLTTEGVLALKPVLAPATLVVHSNYAIHDIWCRNTMPHAPKPGTAAQTVLITRPGFDPVPHLLPAGGVDFARHLKGRLTLSQALAAALAITPRADMSALLSAFLGTSALTLDWNDT
ncbi:MAG: putative DNA-binding domain-containing protein [Rhodobacteraceae bacterium]|nr:putative DNA-binding domain-containing protein [Paracoccaceae bacterium]